MAQLSNDWGNLLTGVQRAAWDLYAANVQVLNKLGDSVLLSGINMFIRSNMVREQSFLGRVNDAPTVFNLGSFSPVTITASVATGVSATFDNADEWATTTGGFLVFFGGKSVSPTINFFSGPYRVFGGAIGDTTTPPTSPFTGTTKYALTLGNTTYFRVRASQADGRLSNVQEVRVVAVA
jgi:hypothetical protein